MFNELVTAKGLTATSDLVVGKTGEGVGLKKLLELGRDFINVLVVDLLFNLDAADLLFFELALMARSRMLLDLCLFAHDELRVRVALGMGVKGGNAIVLQQRERESRLAREMDRG